MTISELYERGQVDEDEAYYVRHIEASELQACPVCGTKSHVHNDAPYGGYFCFRCNVSWQTVH